MPIHVPGYRDRRGRKKSTKRNVVAVLSLTAMVDMFTVMVVFLLQNYAVTGEVIDLPDEVNLPQARTTKELKPSNVVVVSPDRIMVNREIVAEFVQVKEQEDWMVDTVREKVEELIQKGEDEKKTLGSQIKEAVSEAKNDEDQPQIDEFRKITIQADEKVDFLTVKKIMYTVTEAGIYEINFAVIKLPEENEI